MSQLVGLQLVGDRLPVVVRGTRDRSEVGPVLHRAAAPSFSGTLVRQRCTWCGQLLLQHDVDDEAAQKPARRTLPEGRWVMRSVDGSLGFALAGELTEELEHFTCSRLGL